MGITRNPIGIILSVYQTHDTTAVDEDNKSNQEEQSHEAIVTRKSPSTKLETKVP
jgi:hypothetical protein